MLKFCSWEFEDEDENSSNLQWFPHQSGSDTLPTSLSTLLVSLGRLQTCASSIDDRTIHLCRSLPLSINLKSYKGGQITDKDLYDTLWKKFLGKLTYLHWSKGDEMAPTIEPQGGTLLVRKIPWADSTQDFVGDVLVLKDHEKADNYLVRRLAAIEGYEMVSTSEKDKPFVLEEDKCWVLADNENLKPKEANDTRIFGPVPMTDIVGRVIYCLRTPVDHGPVQNRTRLCWMSNWTWRKWQKITKLRLSMENKLTQLVCMQWWIQKVCEGGASVFRGAVEESWVVDEEKDKLLF